VTKLYGRDANSKYVALYWAFSQFLFCFFFAPKLDWAWVVAWAYLYGGVACHALFLAMHELSHYLFFKKPKHNRIFAMLINMATVIPHFSMFTRYHQEHHQYQGVEGLDVDVPSKIEGVFFTNAFTKVIWIFFQPLFYAFRPLLINPKNPGYWEAVNFTFCFSFGFSVAYFLGAKSLVYLLLSSFFGAGLHPIAGHFIAEHYVFVSGHETYSYYGPLNLVSFNVGYHNEHHDFPHISGSKLPLLKKLAPEYYNLPYHSSWVRVIFDYIFMNDIGPYSRVLRKQTASPEILYRD